MKKFKNIILSLDKRIWIFFTFFIVLIFFIFRDLFNAYFEADEWFHFTYYFPLTRKPDGFLTAIVSTFTYSGPLSAGQHVIPVASAIYFLNTKFFGMNYPPYVFMSLLLHSINSFLVFLIIRAFLNKKEVVTKNIFAILSGLFFALSPLPSHAITGASPFYGQNILSVTFFLLCIFSFKLSYLHKSKKFIYLCLFFLFLALFTKETVVFLFVLLPFMGWTELRLRRERGSPAASGTRQRWSRNNQVFPLKFLGKLFVISLIVYLIFRFLVPNAYQGVGTLVDKLVGNYVSSSLPSWQKQQIETPKVPDTGTIVSRDLSFYKNIPGEVMLRTVTFPLRMTGTLFLPRPTVFSIVELITPVVIPLPDSSARLSFSYGAGNFVIIYLAALGILVFCTKLIIKFIRKGYLEDARALATGLAIIILSTLPLVAIMFSFPRWGYDFYFDSRLYYNPNVGAAIVFPFLLLGFSEFISKLFQKKIVVPLIAFMLFTLWLINDIVVLRGDIRYNTQNFQPDRREVVTQLRQHLPELPEEVVFYMETDSLSAYGPNLPFQTGVPQALTVVYYDKSPLPDSFFDKPLFEGKGQGYTYSNGRGFGYYSSKKNLSEALLVGDFEVSDIHAFYYEAQKVKLSDITSKVRQEMKDYLSEAQINLGWKTFTDASGLSFLYPPEVTVTQVGNSIRLESSLFVAEILVTGASQAFDINEYLRISTFGSSDEIVPAKVSFDRFHYNDAVVIIGQSKKEYFIKLDNTLIQLETFNINTETLNILEKILGSIELAQK